MSIIYAVKEYLSKYNGIEILTDKVNEDESIMITPTGSSQISVDLLGNKYYKRSFQVYFKTISSTETERKKTHELIEGFVDWVDNKVDNNDSPILGDGITVEGLDLSNLMLMDVTKGFEYALYQVQLNIIYKKEAN